MSSEKNVKCEDCGEEYRAFQEYRAKLKDKDKDKKQKPRRDQKKAADKKAYSTEQADSDSVASEDEVDEDDGKIDAYHMRIVRNSGYGYPSMGVNDVSVTNENSFYVREFEKK
jgi:hypothetical protein